MNPNLSSATKSYNLKTNGTTTLPGKGVLVALVVNSKGGSGNTVRIYDSNETFGEDPERLKGTLDTVNVFGRVEYGMFIETGIYLVSGGGTAPDITVLYADTP